MVTIKYANIIMSGKEDDAAFVDVRSIGGLGGDAPRLLSAKICSALNDSLGVARNRIYLNFADVKATNWGWSGSTFG